MLILLVCAVLVVVFFMAFPREQTTYGGNKSSTHVFLLSESQAVDMKMGISTDAWVLNAGIDPDVGLTLERNVVVENQATDGYVRVLVRVTGKDATTGAGTTLDPTKASDKETLNRILSTLYYDKSSNLQEGTSYTQSELKELEQAGKINHIFNPTDFEAEVSNDEFVLNGWNEQLQAYSFTYKNTQNANKFFKSSSTRFSTDFVVATDAGQQTLDDLKDYTINVSVQAIAMNSYSGRADALSHIG